MEQTDKSVQGAFTLRLDAELQRRLESRRKRVSRTLGFKLSRNEFYADLLRQALDRLPNGSQK